MGAAEYLPSPDLRYLLSGCGRIPREPRAGGCSPEDAGGSVGQVGALTDDAFSTPPGQVEPGREYEAGHLHLRCR